jgi:hypothetical protein
MGVSYLSLFELVDCLSFCFPAEDLPLLVEGEVG